MNSRIPANMLYMPCFAVNLYQTGKNWTKNSSLFYDCIGLTVGAACNLSCWLDLIEYRLM